jgi:hypothetical protein
VRRRLFDHLATEFAVAVRSPIPRYALWLQLHDQGLDPESLTRAQAVGFCKASLRRFAADQGLRLGIRAHRRLLREIQGFDPERESPAERFGEEFED